MSENIYTVSYYDTDTEENVNMEHPNFNSALETYNTLKNQSGVESIHISEYDFETKKESLIYINGQFLKSKCDNDLYTTLVKLTVKRKLNGVPDSIALAMAEKQLNLNELEAWEVKKGHTFSSDIDKLYYELKGE